MTAKRSRKDEALIAWTEAQRKLRVRAEPVMSFAAGPIAADVARVLFEGLAKRCAELPPDLTLFVHLHHGEQHRDGVVATFYPIATFTPDQSQTTLGGGAEE